MRIRFVALCLVALVSSGLLSASAGADAADGRLSGVVRDDQGEVISSTDVYLVGPDGMARTSTDNSGHYSIPVAPGTYDLRVDSPWPDTSSETREMEDVQVGADTTLHLVLPRPYVKLFGTVRDAEGTPLSDLDVSLGAASTHTQRDGSFSLSVQAGEYDLSVTLYKRDTDPGYFNVTLEDFDLSRDRWQDLTIPFSSATIQVRDQRGADASGAWTHLQGSCSSASCPFEPYPHAFGVSASWDVGRWTDANGRAEMPVLPGSAALRAVSNNPPSTVHTRSVTLPTSAPIQVELADAPVVAPAPTVRLRGKLREADGRPVLGTITLQKDGQWYAGDADENGDFEIGAPGGRYALRISADVGTYRDHYDHPDEADGLFVTIPDFDLTADRTQDLTIPMGSFTVRVVDRQGRPVAISIGGDSGAHGDDGSARVELFPGGVGTGLLRNNNSHTGLNGEGTLRIFPGSPPPEVWAGLPRVFGTAAVEPGAESVTVVLSPVTLQGRVRDPRGVTPGETWVSFANGQVSRWEPFDDWAGQDGSYSLRARPRNYTINVSNDDAWEDYDGNQVSTATLPRIWGFETHYDLTDDTVLDLTLPDGLPADVVVVGGNGLPLPGHMDVFARTDGDVELASGMAGPGWMEDELADDNGHFRPLLFGPSRATGNFALGGNLFYRFDLALAPGDHVAILVPATTPENPTSVEATAGDGAAYVSWTPPEEDGGAPLLGYEVATHAGPSHIGSDPIATIKVAAKDTSATVTGLKNDVEYHFSVAAMNALGRGHAERTSEVVPKRVATVPTQATTPTTGSSTTTSPKTPDPTIVADPQARSGYWMVGSDGKVYPFGDARHLGEPELGSAEGVDLEPSGTGNGYWVLDEEGRVYAYGDAVGLGDADLAAGEKATSLSATAKGYWVFTSTGRVLAFGDAQHYGDMSHLRLNGAVLDSVATPSGEGYYMVASDGGVFTFGDAKFSGSMGGRKLNAPVHSLVPDGDGDGYWLVASDGGIFAFGAPFRGSMGGKPLNRPVTGMVRFGNGYLMVGEDGGVFEFSDRAFHGSLGDRPPAKPVVAVAALS